MRRKVRRGEGRREGEGRERERVGGGGREALIPSKLQVGTRLQEMT